MKILLTCLALVTCVCPAFAQGTFPRFVRLGDLNTSPVTTEPTSGGAALLGNGDLIFSGLDSEAGEEIWIKYSYSNQARRRVDFRPGGASSSPREFAPLNGNQFSVVVDDGITGPEVVVLDSDGDFFPDESGQDLCPGRDHAAPRLLGRVGDASLYILDDGADPFGRPGESVWKFTGDDPPLWLDTFKPGSVRQPRNADANQLYYLGQRWDEAEIALFRVNGAQASHAELLCVMGDPAVAEPLPDEAYAVTPGMVCYRGIDGYQPVLRIFRTSGPGNVLSLPFWNFPPTSIASNGHDRICFTSFDLATGLEPWMIVDDFMGSPLTPQMVVDSNPSTLPVSASRFMMQGNILYFETGNTSRVLKFVDTGLTNRVAYTIFSDSEFITRRELVFPNQLAYVVNTGNNDSLLLYNTTSRTSQSLSQNVNVRHLWAQGVSLNAIIQENEQNDTFYRLDENSWNPMVSFTANSARPLPVTGGESSSSGWLIGTPLWSDQPQLHRYSVVPSVPLWPVPMEYEGPSGNASSHPADFHDINGHLFLTAVKNGQRLLFHSPDGAQDSLQPVMLRQRGSPTVPFAVQESVRLGSKLFVRSAIDGTLHVVPGLVESGTLYSEAVMEGAPNLSNVQAERLTVAAGKVFFVQVGATTETLRFVNPDLTLGTVQVFQKPTAGQAITQMTGTPDRLFFTASTNPNDSTSPVALWSTTGSGMPEQRMLYSDYHSPRILGIWGGHLVFWAAYNEDWFDVLTWSGLPGEGPEPRWGDRVNGRPESSHTPGFPSGIEFDGRFAYCDRKGRLIVLGPSGLEYLWYAPFSFVRPECLANLNEELIWKAYTSRLPPPGMWGSPWFSWNIDGHYDLLGYTEGAPSPLRLAAGRVWSVAGDLNYTVLKSWNGLEGGFEEGTHPLDPNEALGDVSMGTYRGRLLLSARPNFVVHSGFEPMLLRENSAPAAPVPLKLTGARPGQPFVFTYADVLNLGIADAEGDPFSLELSALMAGALQVNGVAYSPSIHRRLYPGDVLQWDPPTGLVGDSPAFQIYASDALDGSYLPVTIRVETPHEEWTRQHFTPEQLADPLVSGPAADADGDGVSNALEFVFGRLPHQPEGERAWTLTSTTPAAGQRRAVFTFNRLAVLPLGAAVLIEQSEDLQSWNPVAIKVIDAAWSFPFNFPGVIVEEVTLPDGRIETRVSVEESASLNRFLRLRVLLL